MQLQCTGKPLRTGCEAPRIAGQLAAKAQCFGIRGIDCQRAVDRLECLRLFAPGIAQPADIDPQSRIGGIGAIGLVESRAGSRQVPLRHFEPAEAPEPLGAGLRRKLARLEPGARQREVACEQCPFAVHCRDVGPLLRRLGWRSSARAGRILHRAIAGGKARRCQDQSRQERQVTRADHTA